MVDVMEAVAFRKERVVWDHAMERELIELICDRPYIWKTSDPDFIKRSMKTRGYEEVAEIMRAMTQQFIDGDTVRQKFCGIRSYFQRELRKIRDSRTENGGKGEYHSKWEHFNSLQFLKNYVGSAKFKKTLEDSEDGFNSTNGEIEGKSLEGDNDEDDGDDDDDDDGVDATVTGAEDMTILVTPHDFTSEEPNRPASPSQKQKQQPVSSRQQQQQSTSTPRLRTATRAAASAITARQPKQSSSSLTASASPARHSQRLAFRLPVFKRKRLSEEAAIPHAATSLRYAAAAAVPKPRDGADGYGDFVAGHMRRMTPQQQLICSNMINDCVRKVLSWTRPFDSVYYEVNIKTDS